MNRKIVAFGLSTALGVVVGVTVARAQELPITGSVDSPLGKLELTNGYPTADTAKKLYDDMDFQRAYGAWLLKHKGTADHWTPLEQIWTGVRAWHQRGFEPWSTSAHACGVY